MTGQHDTGCAPSTSGKLCTHIKHTRMVKGGGGQKKPHNPLTPSDEVQLLANTTYTYHLTHPVITTRSCSRMVTAAGRELGGFWFGAQHHLTHTRAPHRTRTFTKPNRTAPHRTARLLLFLFHWQTLFVAYI